jgi:hypothetical protein
MASLTQASRSTGCLVKGIDENIRAQLTWQGSSGLERNYILHIGSKNLLFELLVNFSVMKRIPKNGSDSDGNSVSASKQVNKNIAHDGTIVDEVWVSFLGFDKVLQKVRHVRVVVGVLAFKASSQMLKRDASDISQIRGTDSPDGVFIEQVVQEWHLSHGSKAIYMN